MESLNWTVLGDKLFLLSLTYIPIHYVQATATRESAEDKIANLNQKLNNVSAEKLHPTTVAICFPLFDSSDHQTIILAIQVPWTGQHVIKAP